MPGTLTINHSVICPDFQFKNSLTFPLNPSGIAPFFALNGCFFEVTVSPAKYGVEFEGIARGNPAGQLVNCEVELVYNDGQTSWTRRVAGSVKPGEKCAFLGNVV